jgi:hypothetical protein
LLSLKISNNVNLTQVSVENCPRLNTVVITDNTALVGDSATNFVTLSDLHAVTTIDLHGNGKLQYVTIDNCNDENVDKLYLYNTKIKGSHTNNTVLDLSKFTNMSKFNICNNTNVEFIQFANIKDKPISLVNPFDGCINL